MHSIPDHLKENNAKGLWKQVSKRPASDQLEIVCIQMVVWVVYSEVRGDKAGSVGNVLVVVAWLLLSHHKSHSEARTTNG